MFRTVAKGLIRHPNTLSLGPRPAKKAKPPQRFFDGTALALCRYRVTEWALATGYPCAGKIFLPRWSKVLSQGDAARRCLARPGSQPKARPQTSARGLHEAHSTALVLNEMQAESVLDLATYTGLHALVELVVKPDDLLDPARAREAVARIARTVNIWRNHSSLIGYLIDCPIVPDQLRLM